MNRIIINEDNNKNITMALKSNGKVVEVYEQKADRRTQEGNVYCGVVRNILPGMQSAFVDIGESKNAFIHIKDILPKANNITGNKEEKFEEYNIKDYVKVGDTILVQGKKDEEGKKGARVSKHISVTGKYVVLMPEVDFVTVSQKIEDDKEKERLKNVVKNILVSLENDKFGVIIRTAAEGVKEDDIKKDVNSLIKLLKKIQTEFDKVKINKKPVKIFENDEFITKLIIGIASSKACDIIVNSDDIYNKVKGITEKLDNKKLNLKLEKVDLLRKYEIDLVLEKMQQRKIWLDCGGFITIDKTEALTAIDINSGKFVGNKHNDKDETIFKVNKEATIEIAKQLRLRNISGIIVVDYIDMENDDYRKELLQILQKEIKKDRSKVQVIGFTKLDLLEITRKKL